MASSSSSSSTGSGVGPSSGAAPPAAPAASAAPSVVKTSILAPPKLGFGRSTPSTSSPAGGSGLSTGGSLFGAAKGAFAFPGFKESKLSAVVPKGKDEKDTKDAKEGNGTTSPESSSNGKSGSTAAGAAPVAARSCSSTATFLPAEPVDAKSSASSFLPLTGTVEEEAAAAAARRRSTADNEKSSTGSARKEAAFVFGQNLSDRVENFDELEKKQRKQKDDQEQQQRKKVATAAPDKSQIKSSPGKEDTGDKNFFFSSNHIESGTPPPPPSSQTTPASGKEAEAPEGGSLSSSKTLTESAAAYLESHQPKRTFEAPAEPQMTGEEDERNVCQLSAKLYVYDKTGSCWQERGRGTLRLNDSIVKEHGEEESRIVMRTAGTCRLILNTKLFKGMSVENPSERNVRLTGYDEEGKIRVFLISGGVKDITLLFKEVKRRQEELDSRAKEEEGPSSTGGKRKTAAPEGDEDEAKRAKKDE